MIRTLLLACCLATPALAQDEERAFFIEANMLATFYHELGHALIDTLDLPVLGREEDAVDALSVLMIDAIWEEESAVELTLQTTAPWKLYAAAAEDSGAPADYWDSHSLDLQRYYNHACLFYGANPDVRAGLAAQLDLPEERAIGCEEEYQQAAGSWAAMFDGLEPGKHSGRLHVTSESDAAVWAPLIEAEVADFNKEYSLPTDVAVAIEDCGEANAFYDPETVRIILCTELAEEHGQLFDSMP